MLNYSSFITSLLDVVPDPYTSLKLSSSDGLFKSISLHSFKPFLSSRSILTCFLSLFQSIGNDETKKIIPKMKSPMALPSECESVELIIVYDDPIYALFNGKNLVES